MSSPGPSPSLHTSVIPRLGSADASRLAPLLAHYAAAMQGADLVAIDPAQAESLLRDPQVEIAGAEIDGALVAFALYYDLPEAISGRRAGQLDDLYVATPTRGRGVAKQLIAHLVEEGARRGWVHLRWMAPENSPATALYNRIAEPAPWRNFRIRIDASVSW